MFESFTDKADLTPYKHEPTRIDLNAINPKTAYGAERSSNRRQRNPERKFRCANHLIRWVGLPPGTVSGQRPVRAQHGPLGHEPAASARNRPARTRRVRVRTVQSVHRA